MEIEFYEEKDLTETYKQLKKMIATVLGENEFETITNTEAKVVANGMWESCYKVSWVSIDYLDVKHFLSAKMEMKPCARRQFLPRLVMEKRSKKRTKMR